METTKMKTINDLIEEWKKEEIANRNLYEEWKEYPLIHPQYYAIAKTYKHCRLQLQRILSTKPRKK